MKRLLFFCLAIGLTGCVTKPTVVRETSTRDFGGVPALLGPIKIDESAVVVDARSTFEFSMARIPRSVQVNWADYSEPEPEMRGWPQKDLFAAARRLARLGISPTSKVIVLGMGADGQGEEGRVAWLLAYLGVDNVRFGRFGSVKARLTNAALPGMGETTIDPRPEKTMWEETRKLAPEEKQTPEAPIWKPVVVSSLIATREEIKGAIENKAWAQPWSYKGAPAKLYRIVDSRTSREYLGQKGGMRSKAVPNIDAINIPMKEFFTDDFRPRNDLSERLLAVGLKPEYRVIVIDKDGVGSAAVTMALRAMGYGDTGNYAGGYNDLMK